MADLNLTITEEQQEYVETRILQDMPAEAVLLTYGSVTSQITSQLLSRGEINNLPETLATEKLYRNLVLKLYNVNEIDVKMASLRLYKDMMNAIDQADQQRKMEAEAAAENGDTPVADIPEVVEAEEV